MKWTDICNKDDILINGGRCALFEQEQVAIFRIAAGQGRDEQFYAIANFDPFSEANVLSRGIVGSIGDALCVASPIYKQHFNLVTGQCVEDEQISIKTYEVRINSNRIELAA